MLAEREWIFEQRQLWELERHSAFNEIEWLQDL
jgi:hypothetical protein